MLPDLENGQNMTVAQNIKFPLPTLLHFALWGGLITRGCFKKKKESPNGWT